MFEESKINKSIRLIKENGYFMRRAFESKNMRESLKYSEKMIGELRIENVDPKEYFTLFTLIFDELTWLQQSLSNIDFSKKKYDLYQTVQFSKQILPRLYLLICIGSVYINQDLKKPLEVLWDILKMLKGVQHPCRGLFLRYFFLKITKEKIESKSEMLNDSTDEIIELLIKNFKEMNSLWIRINSLIEDKTIRRKQRRDLAIVVGENLMRLSTLDCMTLEIYREKVLDQILEIMLEHKDRISQEYLFDCLISTFPDEYHIATLEKLLEATEKLYKRVDLNNIYLKLMERFAQYAENQENLENGNKNLQEMTFIYDYFKKTLNNIFATGKYPLNKLLKLLSGFMNFSLFFYNGKREYINEILQITTTLCEKEEKEYDEKSIENLVNILTTPLKKLSVMVLNIDEFPRLMKILPEAQKKEVAIKICKAIVSTKSYLVNQEICHKVVKFVEPLFSVKTTNEANIKELSRVLNYIDCAKPKEALKMLKQFEINFDKYDKNHLKHLYMIYIQRVLYILEKTVSMKNYISDFFNKNGNEIELQVQQNENTNEDQNKEIEIKTVEKVKNSNKKLMDLIKTKFGRLEKAVYLTQEEKDNFFLDIQNDLNIDFSSILEDINKINNDIEIEFPLTSMQIYLDLTLIIDRFGDLEHLEDLLYECIQKVVEIFENDIGEQKSRIFYFNKILGYLSNLKNTNPELLEQIFGLFKAGISILGNRDQQAKAVLNFSRLYFDQYKIKECVQRSIKLIKMSLKYNKESLLIYVKVLDTILEYMNSGFQGFTVDELKLLIKIIKDNLDELMKGDYLQKEEIKKNCDEYLKRVVDFWLRNSQNENILEILKTV